MLTRLTSVWLLGLVLCPFTAPFQSSDLMALLDDAGQLHAPPGSGRLGAAADHSRPVTVVPLSRARSHHSLRLAAPVRIAWSGDSAATRPGSDLAAGRFGAARADYIGALPILRL